MNWRKWFSPSDADAAVNATDINTKGAPYDGGGIRSVIEAPVAPDGSDPHLPEEIKRRQVALLLRYVMTIRVR
jgi:hypothetical protein